MYLLLSQMKRGFSYVVCSQASSSVKMICSELYGNTHTQWHNSKYSIVFLPYTVTRPELFYQIPSTLHKEVSDKLACLAEGKQTDAMGNANCYLYIYIKFEILFIKS